MMAALFCPLPHVTSAAADLKRALGWPTDPAASVVGVHIRRRDRTDLLEYTLDGAVYQCGLPCVCCGLQWVSLSC